MSAIEETAAAEPAPEGGRKGGFDLRQQGPLIAPVAAFVGAELFPLLFDSGSDIIDVANYALAYVIMALGLNIVVGFAGLLDLGYVAFFAIGAYAIGWFGSSFFDPEGKAFIQKTVHVGVSDFAQNLPGFHFNYLLIIVIAAILAALLGAILGFPTLRLRGDYIAIVTLAFGEIIGRAAINGQDIGGKNFTNGKIGINPIDAPNIFGKQFSTLELRPWYYLALALVLIVLFCNFRLRDSRLGRAWIAVREDEVAAVSMGIPTVKVKLLAYALGAAFGGISGTFLGAYIEQVNADQFAFSFSIFILAMIILGGLGSIWGVVIGSVALTLINRLLIPKLNGVPEKFGLDFDPSQLGFGIFGFLLVIMMVLRPQGLFPERRRARELTEADEDVVEVRA